MFTVARFLKAQADSVGQCTKIAIAGIIVVGTYVGKSLLRRRLERADFRAKKKREKAVLSVSALFFCGTETMPLV